MGSRYIKRGKTFKEQTRREQHEQETEQENALLKPDSSGSTSYLPVYISLNENNDSMIEVLLDAKTYGEVYGRDTLYVAEEDSTDYFDVLYQMNVMIDE